MKIFKKVIIVVIAVLLIVYVGYKFNLFPTRVIEQGSQELQEKIDDIEEQTGEKSWLRKIFEGLDVGMQSNASKKEQNNATEFERSLECFVCDDIIDGDTIIVSNDNHVDGIKVRYIGIDTPESAHEDASKNTPEGKVAARRNSDLIEEKNFEVYLELDTGKTDEYGRTLAYVYLYDYEKDEYKMIQDILLVEGLCRTMTIEPNTKYAKHFEELESVAKKNETGFWKTGFYK